MSKDRCKNLFSGERHRRIVSSRRPSTGRRNFPNTDQKKVGKIQNSQRIQGHIYKLNTWLDSETEILKNMPENPIKSRSIYNYFYTRPKAHMQDDVVLVFKTFINPTLRNEQINWHEYDRRRIEFTYPLSRLPENLFRELTEYLVNPSDSNTTNPVHDDALINLPTEQREFWVKHRDVISKYRNVLFLRNFYTSLG